MQNSVSDIEIEKEDQKQYQDLQKASEIRQWDHRKPIAEELFKYSPYMNKYKKEFFNYPRQTKENKSSFDFRPFEARFRKYGVTYNPQRSIAMPFMLCKKRQEIRGKIKNYLAKFSYFSVDISIYNQVNDSFFDVNLLYENFITSGSFGSICSYEVQTESGTAKFIIKLLKFNQTPWQVIYSAIKQYAFMKVFAALKLGPELQNPFGFDIITTSTHVLFSMEKGINVQDFMRTLTRSRRKIKPYLNKLEEQIKILHFFSIVHVDIKPQNIIFSPKFEKLIFIDFGLTESLQFPIGTLQLVTFRGSFLYCSQQMKQLFSQGGNGYVDMYYNDLSCWRNTKEQILANQSNKSFCLSAQMVDSIKDSFEDQNYYIELGQFGKKNQKLTAYFEKVKIVNLINTNTRQGFHQWFIQHESLKKILWKDDAFFNELIETYNLRQLVYRSPIIESKLMTETDLSQIENSVNRKQESSQLETYLNKNPQLQYPDINHMNSSQAQNIIKRRFNDEYFLEKQNIQQLIQNIKNRKKPNLKHQTSQTITPQHNLTLPKLKELVLKTIINQFDFLKGMIKDDKQMLTYLLETIKLVLNQDQAKEVEALNLKHLVKYCLNFASNEILSFLENFSVPDVIYRFITSEIIFTEKIKEFAESIKPEIHEEANIGHTFDLSFFYFDLQKYVMFLINKFQAENDFETGYSAMQKIKFIFHQKINSFQHFWESLNAQFIYSSKHVKQYLSSQIIKTYIKQSLMRCSYFYCKLISEMFFFAHQKQNLPKMQLNLLELNSFLKKCAQDPLLEGIIIQDPVFLEYKYIMKFIYTLYIVPSSSYKSINIRKKVEYRIDLITNNQEKFRKDQCKHFLFILHTLYIQILASQNRFTDLFVALEKCFEIVRYWRCEFLFLNVITIMSRFHNDEITKRARNYLKSMATNVFSSMNYGAEQGCTRLKDNFLLKNLKNIGSGISQEKFLEQHLKMISKLCNFQKIAELTSQTFNEYSKQNKETLKLGNDWISKYRDILIQIQQKAQGYLKTFKEEVDIQKAVRQQILKNQQHLELITIDMKLARELAVIQVVLFHYNQIQNSVVVNSYERLRQIEGIYDPFNKIQSNQSQQEIYPRSIGEYLDIIYIKIQFLSFVNASQDYKLIKLINDDKDVLRRTQINFKKAFEIQCFINNKNDLTYLQTYLKIINKTITKLNLSYNKLPCFQETSKYIFTNNFTNHNLPLFTHFQKLQNIFSYMNAGVNFNSPVKMASLSENNYLSLIFTLNQEYVEMCLNLCKYYTELMKNKICAIFSPLLKKFSQKIKELNSEQLSELEEALFKESIIVKVDCKNEIQKLFFLFQQLTYFTTKYSCKNYSQFIFGIANGFVSSFEQMKKQLLQKFHLLPHRFKVKRILFSELEQQLLEKIQFTIIPERLIWKMSKFDKENLNLNSRKSVQNLLWENDGYSRQYIELIRVKQQIRDQRRNREIIFVSLIVLKASVDLHPEQCLKLIKIIISRQLSNLYSYSRKLIGQNIEKLLIYVYSSIIEKFIQDGIKSGISLVMFDKLQQKLCAHRKKHQKLERIKDFMRKKNKRL